MHHSVVTCAKPLRSRGTAKGGLGGREQRLAEPGAALPQPGGGPTDQFVLDRRGRVGANLGRPDEAAGPGHGQTDAGRIRRGRGPSRTPAGSSSPLRTRRRALATRPAVASAGCRKMRANASATSSGRAGSIVTA